MSDKETQVNWNDDDFLDVDECHAKVKQLRAELAQTEFQLAQLAGAEKAFIEATARAQRAELGIERVETLAKELQGERDYWRRECKRSKRPAVSDTEEIQRRLTTTEALLDISNAKLQKRQGSLDRACIELDAAEAALADCGIAGINAPFTGLADAINQMTEHIKEQSDTIRVHKHALDERDKVLQTERQLRQEAEQRAEEREGERDKWRMDWENAAAELSNGHGTLTAADVPRSDATGNLSITGRVVRLKQRAERAEALAQLVNGRMASLLEQLADFADASWGPRLTQAAKEAHKLAAQIREALDDSQA